MMRLANTIDPQMAADFATNIYPTRSRDAGMPERWHGDEPPTEPCRLWLGATNNKGYGRAFIGGRGYYVHRLALVAALGRDLAPGLQADHRCENRLCGQASHLAEATPRDNVLAGTAPAALNAAKDDCPEGHDLGGENVAPSSSANGWRRCRVCNRARAAGKSARTKAAHEHLGLTKAEYIAQHGQTATAAAEVLGAEMADAIYTAARDAYLQGHRDTLWDALACDVYC